MKFVPFAELTRPQQEAVILAPRPLVNIEPLILGDEGNPGLMMASLHMQVGDSHVVLTMNDLLDHRKAINQALDTLLEHFPKGV